MVVVTTAQKYHNLNMFKALDLVVLWVERVKFVIPSLFHGVFETKCLYFRYISFDNIKQNFSFSTPHASFKHQKIDKNQQKRHFSE